MTCEDVIAQCFLDERAPLAVPELNRERTLKYLECCDQQGLTWGLWSQVILRQSVMRKLPGYSSDPRSEPIA